MGILVQSGASANPALRLSVIVKGFQWYPTVLEMLLEAFPEIHFEMDDLIAERDIVICWGIFNCGVQAKEWAGVAPKGRSLVFHGTTLHRIRDGKIIEQWHDEWYTSVPEMVEMPRNPGCKVRVRAGCMNGSQPDSLPRHCLRAVMRNEIGVV